MLYISISIQGEGHVNSNKGSQGSIKFNNKQFVIRNLGSDITEDAVRKFFRALSGKDPLSIKFNHDITAAMAGFRKALGKCLQMFIGVNIEWDGVTGTLQQLCKRQNICNHY